MEEPPLGSRFCSKRGYSNARCLLRYKSKLALLIFAQTISIQMWYRYDFLSFLAVFEISSAKEHIFDSCKCITYLLGWVLSKISKKPYLYRTGIDMVFQFFLLLIFMVEPKCTLDEVDQ